MYLFTDKVHQYFSDDDGEELISISAATEPYYKSDFDKIAWIRAFRNLECGEQLYKFAKEFYKWDSEDILPFLKTLAKHLGIEVKETKDLKRSWSKKGEVSSEYGTYTHLQKENEAIEDGFFINPFNGVRHQVICYDEFIPEGFDNAYLLDEILMANIGKNIAIMECMLVSYPFAGQSDIILYEWTNKGWLAYVLDYKTDKEIDKETFYQTLKPPFQDYPNSRFYRYAMKMSCYCYMLNDVGIKTYHKTLIIHIPEGGEEANIELPILPVETIFKNIK